MSEGSALTFARRNVVDEKSGPGERKTCTGGSRCTCVRVLDGFTRGERREIQFVEHENESPIQTASALVSFERLQDFFLNILCTFGLRERFINR